MSQDPPIDAGSIVPLDLEEAVARAVRAAGAAMSALSGELDAVLVERDLQEVLVVALRKTCRRSLRVGQNHKVDFTQWQPPVGPVDVALSASSMSPASAFVELKWGAGTLYNCVWDLAKMAVAVAGGYAQRAFLVAGAPVSDWSGSEGGELFAPGVWLAPYLRQRYAHHWKFWCGDVKTRPQSLPSEVATMTVAVAPMTILGSAWALRAVEVVADPAAWLDVPRQTDR